MKTNLLHLVGLLFSTYGRAIMILCFPFKVCKNKRESKKAVSHSTDFFFGVMLADLTVQISVVSIITAIFNTKYVHFVHTEYSCVPYEVYKKHLLFPYAFLTNLFL